MLTVNSLASSRSAAMLAYGFAILSAVGVAIGDHEMQVHLHDSAPVSMFLIAVAATAALGGARPALLTTVLAVLAFSFDLLLGSASGVVVTVVRVLALAVLGCYVVWLTATHKDALISLRSAHESLKLKHEALEQAADALRESADRQHGLSQRLLTVQEDERRHLARELHDEFGQLLVSIGMQLSAARRSSPEVANQLIDESVPLIESATTQLRSLVVDLRPSVLDRAGLDAALEWLTEQWARRTGLSVTRVGEIGELTDVLAIGCFRVVQEALTNVARHARARNVWVELKRTETTAEIVVRDDGIGFWVGKTLRAAADKGRFGLIGMRERAQLLGGELLLDAEPGRGTRVRLRIAIPPR